MRCWSRLEGHLTKRLNQSFLQVLWTDQPTPRMHHPKRQQLEQLTMLRQKTDRTSPLCLRMRQGLRLTKHHPKSDQQVQSRRLHQ
jgi:hypothetical protein